VVLDTERATWKKVNEMAVVMLVAALIVLDLLALRFGADSRRTGRPATW
jgi:hypothetical protein